MKEKERAWRHCTYQTRLGLRTRICSVCEPDSNTSLACSAASDIQGATRQGSLAGVQEEAARKVIGTLISALKDFVAGVSKAAGFFSVMEQELKKLEVQSSRRKICPQVSSLQGNEKRSKRHEIHLSGFSFSPTRLAEELFIDVRK